MQGQSDQRTAGLIAASKIAGAKWSIHEPIIDRRCPICGYSRSGLESKASCPECGWQPSEGMVLLWFNHLDRKRFARATQSGLSAVAWIILILQGGLQGFRIFKAIQRDGAITFVLFTAVLAIVITAIVLFVWYRRSKRDEEGNVRYESQLQLTSKGYAIRMGPGRVRYKSWKGRKVSYSQIGELMKITFVRPNIWIQDVQSVTLTLPAFELAHEIERRINRWIQQANRK